MPTNASSSNKGKQLSLEEYAKIKEKLTKSKLKLSFPWAIKVCFLIPLLYVLFLIVYYLLHLRFLPEH
jgi:cell division septal protein FtsQ